MIDLHTHILPGVDDGAATPEDCTAMLQSAAEHGVRVIAATSHYSRSCEQRYDASFAQAAGFAEEAGIRLIPGMEYDYDLLSEVPPERQRGIGGGAYLLIDLKQPFVAPGVAQMLYELQLHGRRVLVAHPERLFAQHIRECVAELRRSGAFFQVNSGSILGRYGAYAERAAWYMLRAGFCDLIADDAHQASGFRLDRCRELLGEYFPAEALDLWFECNPERLLDGQPLRVRKFAMRPMAALKCFFKYGPGK